MPTVRLEWEDPNAGVRQEDEFRVYRATAPIDAGSLPAPIAILPPDTLTYDDVSAVESSSYWYGVAGVKGATVAVSFTGMVTTPSDGILSYQFTIPAGRVSANLTAFVTEIDLSDMPASFWGQVREDGGNIRAYESDGVTLLPIDVVYISKGAQIGRAFVRRSLATATATVFRLHVLGAATGPLAVNDPNGRNAVWQDYEAVYHIGSDPFDRTGKAGSLRILGDPDLLEEVASSPDVNGHEGVATDGTHYYVFDSFALRKYDLTWTLVSQITDIATRYGNGLGGGCVSGGIIYVAADNGGVQYLAKYRASDLVWLADHNIESFASGAADFCMVDGELRTIQWATSPGTGSIIRINPSTGANLGSITLSQNLSEAQGITFWRGAYWVTVDDLDETYRITPTGTVTSTGLFGPRSTPTSWEGIDVAPGGDGLIVMDDTGTVERVRTFKDRMLAKAAGGGAECWADSRIIADLTSAGVLGTTWTVGVTIFASTKEQRYYLGVVPTGGYSSTQSVHVGVDFISLTDSRIGVFDGSNSPNWQYAAGDVQVSTTAAQMIDVVYEGTTRRSIFVNGGSKGTDNTITSRGAGIRHLVIGAAIENAFTDAWRGLVGGIVYARKQALADAWIAARHLNATDPGAFYTVTEL